MVLPVGADHLDVLGGDVRLLVAFAQRTLDGALTVRRGAARDAPGAAFGAPQRAMLHHHMRHLAGDGVTTGQQHAGGAVEAPVAAAAVAVDPAVARLMHVLLGRHRTGGGAGHAVGLGGGVVIAAGHVPQVRPFHTQLAGQPPGQRQAQADDAVRIALDAVDERAAEAFQRKGAGHLQRFAGGNVALDVAVGIIAEMHDGVADAAGHAPGGEVDQAVAGPQLAAVATHGPEPFACHVRAVGLAVAFAVEQEHRVAAQDQRADRGGGQALDCGGGVDAGTVGASAAGIIGIGAVDAGTALAGAIRGRVDWFHGCGHVHAGEIAGDVGGFAACNAGRRGRGRRSGSRDGGRIG